MSFSAFWHAKSNTSAGTVCLKAFLRSASTQYRRGPAHFKPWLRLLRNQGLSSDQLNTVFVGLIVSRLLYALPAWGALVSAAQVGRIDAFLKRAHKWSFCKDVVTLNELLIKSGSSLFHKMQSPVHCLNSLLPPKKETDYKLRNRHCSYTLPSAIIMLLSIHLSIGAFLHCNFLSFVRLCNLVFLSLHCISFHCIIFLHVCCMMFNKVLVSVSVNCRNVRKCCVWQKPL